MKYDDNFIHKYYATFFCQRIMKIYLLDQNMIQQTKQFILIKTLFIFIIKQIKEF